VLIRRAPVVVLVLAAALVGGVRGGFTDRWVYRFAGRAVLDGTALYGVRDPVEGLPFTYPPFAAVLMTPLAWLPPWLLAALWSATSVAALAAVVLLVRRSLGRPAPAWSVAALAVLAFALEPVWQNAVFGQVNTFVMLAVLVDLLRPERRWSGVLLGIAAGVKLTPLVFVVLLVLVGYRSAAARATATFAATVVVGVLVMPGAATTYWTERLLSASRVGPPALAHNQSVLGVLTRLGESVPSTTVWLAVEVPLAVGILLVAAGWWRRGDRVLGTCLGAVAMLLASPVSWSHHWVWSLPVALLLWVRHRWAAAGWTAVFVLRPILWPPWGGGREFGWSPVQQVPGNAYVLAGLALAAWAAVALVRIGRPARRGECPSAHPDGEPEAVLRFSASAARSCSVARTRSASWPG
jgi:alpha-1,2-mannosyltransferase